MGVAGKFPAEYISSVFSGQALGGIFASATNVVMLAIGLDFVDAAFFDFMIATVFLCSALIFFIKVTRTEFYQVIVCNQSIN